MTKEKYIEIREAIKSEIKRLTEIQKHNKKSVNHNLRYCLRSSGKYDPSKSIISQKRKDSSPSSLQFSLADFSVEITRLHIFYNKFRNKKPHTDRDDALLSTRMFDHYMGEFLRKTNEEVVAC